MIRNISDKPSFSYASRTPMTVRSTEQPSLGQWSDNPALVAGLVRAQIDETLTEIKTALGRRLIGVYLHGSLASRCTHPERRDLDLLVIHTEPLEPSVRRQLLNFMLERSGSPCPIEISFILRAHLLRWRHPCAYDLHYSEDRRTEIQAAVEGPELSGLAATGGTDIYLTAHITNLVSHGKCLTGAPIGEVFPEVPRQHFSLFLRDHLRWLVLTASHYPVYTTLTACRMSAYFVDGLLLSKEEAAVWGLENLPGDYQHHILCALEAYQRLEHQRPMGTAQIRSLLLHAASLGRIPAPAPPWALLDSRAMPTSS
jgi:predicted nucleotidyltransferase